MPHGVSRCDWHEHRARAPLAGRQGRAAQERHTSQDSCRRGERAVCLNRCQQSLARCTLLASIPLLLAVHSSSACYHSGVGWWDNKSSPCRRCAPPRAVVVGAQTDSAHRHPQLFVSAPNAHFLCSRCYQQLMTLHRYYVHALSACVCHRACLARCELVNATFVRRRLEQRHIVKEYEYKQEQTDQSHKARDTASIITARRSAARRDTATRTRAARRLRQ